MSRPAREGPARNDTHSKGVQDMRISVSLNEVDVQSIKNRLYNEGVIEIGTPRPPQQQPQKRNVQQINYMNQRTANHSAPNILKPLNGTVTLTGNTTTEQQSIGTKHRKTLARLPNHADNFYRTQNTISSSLTIRKPSQSDITSIDDIKADLKDSAITFGKNKPQQNSRNQNLVKAKNQMIPKNKLNKSVPKASPTTTRFESNSNSNRNSNSNTINNSPKPTGNSYRPPPKSGKMAGPPQFQSLRVINQGSSNSGTVRIDDPLEKKRKQENTERLMKLIEENGNSQNRIGEFENPEYIETISRSTLTATIFVPKFILKKTFQISMNQKVSDLINKILQELNSPASMVEEFPFLFFPKSSIWLAPSRPLYSYCFSDNEFFELLPFSSSSLSTVKVKIHAPGKNDSEEIVCFSPLTKVSGILQCLQRKHIQHFEKYTLYNSNNLALNHSLSLSSYKSPELFYKEKTEETRIAQSKGRVLLKILLVEAAASKLIKFDKTSTIGEAIMRITVSFHIENHHKPIYRLFIPLGAPLELRDTLEQLELQDYDCLEFKKLPPHLLQFISPKNAQTQSTNARSSGVLITEWTTDDVVKWLNDIGYGELAPDFVRLKITGDALFALTKESLRDQLNITPFGIRKGLLREIRKLAVCSQIDIQKQISAGPTPSTSQRKNVTTTIRQQLFLSPPLAFTDTFEVEERDVIHLDFDIVNVLIKRLDTVKCFDYEGIFRVSGAKVVVERIYASLKNPYPNFNEADPHDIASTLKYYLRSLEEPLISVKTYPVFVSSFSESGINEEILRRALRELPPIHYESFKLLVKFCHKITEHEDVNKMNSRNLGIVFGPTVMRNRDPYIDFANAAAHTHLFRVLVDNYHHYFEKTV